jgi:hypothetical protein
VNGSLAQASGKRRDDGRIYNAYELTFSRLTKTVEPGETFPAGTVLNKWLCAGIR